MNKVMYSIYHIPNVKIGCSTNPKLRVKSQGYSNFEILEEHTCIDTVSKRELELQKEYGYKVDKSTYKLSAVIIFGVKNRKKVKNAKNWYFLISVRISKL